MSPTCFAAILSPTGALRILHGRLAQSLIGEVVLDGSVYDPRPLHSSEQLAEFWNQNHHKAVVRLLGEFNALTADHTTQSVFLFADPLGVRPLYYAQYQGSLLVSGSLPWLIDQLPSVSPNEEAICYYLLRDWPGGEHTFYREIRRVIPGTYLRWKAGKLTSLRSWEFEPPTPSRFRDPQEAAERFHHLLRQSIQRRVPKPESLGIWLSGGVDSSGLCAVTHECFGSQFTSLSALFEDPTCDNRQWIRRLTQDQTWRHYDIEMPEGEGFPAGLPTRSGAAVFYHPVYSAFMKLHRHAQALGLNLLFNGLGGDDVFGLPMTFLADNLRTFNLRGIRDCFTHRAADSHSRWDFFWRYGVRPLIPAPLTQWIRTAFPARYPDWAGEKLRNSGTLEKIARRNRDTPYSKAPYWQRDLFIRLFRWGGYPLAMEQEQLAAAEFGLTWSYPYFDLDLIQFVFSCPPEILMNQKWQKLLLRRGLENSLPREIIYQANTQDYTPYQAGIFRRFSSPLLSHLDHSRIVEMGLLSPSGMRRLQTQGQSHNPPDLLFPLFSLERFLRATAV